MTKIVFNLIVKKEFIYYSKGMQLFVNFKIAMILLNSGVLFLFLVYIAVDIYFKDVGKSAIQFDLEIEKDLFFIMLVYVSFYIIKDLITNIKNL
ncbi:MAG: hypothetical protein L3J12_01660 [Spirochaetales bacterium]|nr:hypothetical protein [Spirochaetales bacterium]